MGKTRMSNHGENLDDSISASDDEQVEINLAPFIYNQFKQKSNWKPPGSRILENVVFLNEEGVEKKFSHYQTQTWVENTTKL